MKNNEKNVFIYVGFAEENKTKKWTRPPRALNKRSCCAHSITSWQQGWASLAF
jgi:hypothetical protein